MTAFKLPAKEAKRLRKIADLLDTVPENQFDQDVYADGDGVDDSPRGAAKGLPHACGSSACTLGWAAVAFPRIAARHVGWLAFERALLPAVFEHDHAGNYLFGSADTRAVRHDPRLAARRLRLVADGRFDPKVHDSQDVVD